MVVSSSIEELINGIEAIDKLDNSLYVTNPQYEIPRIEEVEKPKGLENELVNSVYSLQNSAAYAVMPSDRYKHDEWYTTWFLRPITLGTKQSLGWDEGLGGLNYTELGHRFARWDWNHRPAHNVVAHEMKHDGPLFKNHNLAEYWNRMTDPIVISHRRQPLPHQPNYADYSFF